MNQRSFSDNILYQFFIIFLSLVFGTIIKFHVETIIGKSLSPETYGDYKVVLTVLAFLGQTLLFGFDTIILKHVPKLLSEKDFSKTRFFLTVILRIIIFVLLIWLVVGLCVNPLAHRLALNKATANYIHPVYFYLGFACLFALFTLSLKIIKAFGHNILFTLIYDSSSLVLLLLVLGASLTFEGAILRNVISITIVAFVAFVIIFSFLRKSFPTKFALPQNIYHDAFHYVSQQIWAFPVPSILLILLEALPVNESGVGIFSAAFVIAGLFSVVSFAVKNVFLNSVLDAIHGNKSSLKKLLSKIYFITTFMALSIGMLLYFLSPILLQEYGIHFHSALRFIPFAILGFVPSTITSGDLIFINYSDSETNHLLTYLIILKALAAVILGTILILLFNLDGAIITYITIEIVFAIFVVLLKQKAIKKITI